MRIFRKVMAGAAILMIPIAIGLPVTLFPTADPQVTLTPREALLAQVETALEAAQPVASGIGLVPVLVGVGVLLLGTTWLTLRQRPRQAPPRAPRASRAELALELLRDGETPERAVVRAHVSRDAIELLRHVTIGHSTATRSA